MKINKETLKRLVLSAKKRGTFRKYEFKSGSKLYSFDVTDAHSVTHLEDNTIQNYTVFVFPNQKLIAVTTG